MDFFVPEVSVSAMILLCYYWGRTKSASPFWKINNPQTNYFYTDYFYPAKMISSAVMCCNMFRMTVLYLASRLNVFWGGQSTSLKGVIFLKQFIIYWFWILFLLQGALVKTDEQEVINFLLTTEIIPLCLRIMESGSELSKTVPFSLF